MDGKLFDIVLYVSVRNSRQWHVFLPSAPKGSNAHPMEYPPMPACLPAVEWPTP